MDGVARRKPDHASEVLAGPVGEVVCATWLGLTPETVDAADQVAEATLPLLRDQLADPGYAEQVLRCLDEVSEVYPFGLQFRWHQARAELRSFSRALGRVAALLPGSPATRWWWSPVEPVQWWCGAPEMDLPDERRAPTRLAEDAPAPGEWWSFPCEYNALLHTTGTVHRDMPVKLFCRDDEIIPEQVARWELTLHADVRVFEITCAEDWIGLVEAYPREAAARDFEWSRWPGSPGGPWLLPDWQRAARDWDGVHVTIGGYLSCAYWFLPVDGGHTMLAGLAPDETVWIGSEITVSRRRRDTVTDPLR